MTDEPMTVAKYGTTIPVSIERLTADPAPFAAAFTSYLAATPQQRAEWARERKRREAEATRERAAVRVATKPTLLNLEALLDEMGWSREYAEHLVQPYCDCGDDIDGWSCCEHARDLGLTP